MQVIAYSPMGAAMMIRNALTGPVGQLMEDSGLAFGNMLLEANS